jgi:hypothetical protein
MYNVSKTLYSSGNSLFQTAMFSMVGFSGSMALTVFAGFRAAYPWWI